MVRDRLADALSARYRVGRELGAGGMATVYLAEDLRHRRNVAIKVLRPELALGADRFLREIETTANLRHPHILPLYDSGEADGLLYYVMPYVEGESLRDRLARERRLPMADLLLLAREIADALTYAHGRGVIHRDIKPENILLEGGHAVVADFGIARAVSAAGPGQLTQTGMAIGTIAYMSPEQALAESTVDARADQYSLACMMYECLAGELPFTGSPAAMLAQRITTAPPSVRERRADARAEVDQALRRALSSDPAARFASCQEFAAELSTQAPARAAPARPAIVVLPFANRSPDPENEYFSDGLTEEIISDLSAIRSLQVISRSSAMLLKGTDKDVRTIGRELGVRYVLEGSVRKAGNSLRITAQLIDAPTDSQLWGDKYGGTLDDVFELQERVSREIVAALGITLTSDEDRRLAHRSIENVRAFELYLQARQEMRRYDRAAIERGEALVRRAIELEGPVPALEALMAWGQASLVRAGLAADRTPLVAAAEVANRLLVTAPDAPYGHSLLGFIAYENGQMGEAVRHLNAALERDSSDPDALFYLGVSYLAGGQCDQLERIVERLMQIDPLSPMTWGLAGIAPWWTGHLADGLPHFDRSLEIDPTNMIMRWSRAYNRALTGDVAGAAADAEILQKLAPDMPYTSQVASLVHAMSGRADAARAALGNASGLDAHHKFHLAEAYAMAGDHERALELLDQAVHGGFHPGDFISKHCPFFASLRGSPRFEGLAADAVRLTAEFGAAASRP